MFIQEIWVPTIEHKKNNATSLATSNDPNFKSHDKPKYEFGIQVKFSDEKN